MENQEQCPCDSGLFFSKCCGPVLQENKPAKTAETLMRSRYTAYLKKDSAYLIKSWHPSTRPSRIDPSEIPAWCSLEVIRTEKGEEKDLEGVVEFRAIAMAKNKPIFLYEISRFVQENGHWFYLDGKIVPEQKQKTTQPKRNSPCPCGSGKKYKKCCNLTT